MSKRTQGVDTRAPDADPEAEDPAGREPDTLPAATDDADGGRSPGRLRAWYRRSRVLRRGVLSLIAGFALWEVVGRTWANPLFFPPLSDIWSRFTELAGSGALLVDIAASAQEYFLGLLFATLAGVTIGVLMAASRLVRNVLDPWVSLLYATPVIALAPLFILIFGLGITSKVAVVFLVMVFPILINTMAGFMSTDEQLVEAARSFSANRWQIYLKVKLPMALPFLVAGLRLAASHGLVGIVVAEFFGAREGIGLLIEESAQTFDTRALFVGIFVLGLTGVAVTYGLMALEHRLARWRHQEADET